MNSLKSIILLSFILLFSACTPSVIQLKRMDFVKDLKQKTLQVALTDVSEDVELLRKYGQDKKAERVLKRAERENENLIDAVNDEFDFCKVVFVPLLQLDLNEPWLRIDDAERPTPQDDPFRGLIAEIIDNGESEIIAEHEFSLSLCVRNLNTNLNRQFNRAKKL